MNDIDKMGIFIQQLRKEQNLTQKELAEQLGITDKAVSKWERGLSCPDISLIIPLAKLLGVTTSELLSGERTQEPPQEHIESVVEEALEYSGKSRRFKKEEFKNIIMIILSATFLLAAAICLICDYVTIGGITWSAIVIVSLILGWILMLPFFQEKEKSVKRSLIILSLAIIPYLAALSWILKMPLVVKLGTCISLVSLAGLWCVYAVFRRLWHRKLCAAGITFLLVIPLVTWAINLMTSFSVGGNVTDLATNIVNMIFSVFLALACFGLDYLIVRRAASSEEKYN